MPIWCRFSRNTLRLHHGSLCLVLSQTRRTRGLNVPMVRSEALVNAKTDAFLSIIGRRSAFRNRPRPRAACVEEDLETIDFYMLLIDRMLDTRSY